MQENEKAWHLKSVLSKKECNRLKNYLLLKKLILEYRLVNGIGTVDDNKLYGWGFFGDPQSTNNTYNNYGDTLTDTYLLELQHIFQKYSKYTLYPTYTYMRLYKKGAILEKHIDRPSCALSGTLFVSGTEWPIFVSDKKYNLKQGDILIYKGAEEEHWREELLGDYCLQVFFHYSTDKNLVKDKRIIFGMSPM